MTENSTTISYVVQFKEYDGDWKDWSSYGYPGIDTAQMVMEDAIGFKPLYASLRIVKRTQTIMTTDEVI